MSKCFRKQCEDDIKYIDKSNDHTKHDYKIECVLDITYTNKLQRSTYLTHEYHKIIKCTICNSFHAIEDDDFKDKYVEPNSLSNSYLITADYDGKGIGPLFNSLKNIKYYSKKM